MTDSKTISVEDESGNLEVEVTAIEVEVTTIEELPEPEGEPRSKRIYPRPYLKAYQAVDLLFNLGCEDEPINFVGHNVPTLEVLEKHDLYDKIQQERAADVRLAFMSGNPNMKAQFVNGSLWSMVIDRITWGPL
jgi:hypothetical protein